MAKLRDELQTQTPRADDLQREVDRLKLEAAEEKKRLEAGYAAEIKRLEEARQMQQEEHMTRFRTITEEHQKMSVEYARRRKEFAEKEELAAEEVSLFSAFSLPAFFYPVLVVSSRVLPGCR